MVCGPAACPRVRSAPWSGFDLDRDLRVRRNNVLNMLGAQTGVNRTFLDQDGVLEHLAQKIAVAKAAMAVLGKGRVVGHVAIEAKAAEPAIGQIEVNLVTQPPLGT